VQVLDPQTMFQVVSMEEEERVKPGPVAVPPARMVGAEVCTPVTPMVIEPADEVLMLMFAPLTKVVGPYLWVPSSASICPCTVGAVVVPVPPLFTAMAVPLHVPVEMVPKVVMVVEPVFASIAIVPRPKEVRPVAATKLVEPPFH
jgi:hypothetical protein